MLHPPLTHGRREHLSNTVLILQQYWMDKILDGYKTLEIRKSPVHKHVGKRIWLAASCSSAISGSVELGKGIGPLSKSDWHDMRPMHCIPDDERLYCEKTYAYVLRAPQRVPTIPLQRKRGAIIWQDLAASAIA